MVQCKNTQRIPQQISRTFWISQVRPRFRVRSAPYVANTFTRVPEPAHSPLLLRTIGCFRPVRSLQSPLSTGSETVGTRSSHSSGSTSASPRRSSSSRRSSCRSAGRCTRHAGLPLEGAFLNQTDRQIAFPTILVARLLLELNVNPHAPFLQEHLHLHLLPLRSSSHGHRGPHSTRDTLLTIARSQYC